MIESKFNRYTYNTIIEPVISAGIAAIFNFSNPRAAAAAVIAANAGSVFFCGAAKLICTNPENSLLFWGGAAVATHLAGYKAGKIVDPQFGVAETFVSCATANAATLLAVAVGIQKM